MDTEYGSRYAELYRQHWWWRARETAVLEEIRRLREGRGRTLILDVGCGDGLFFDRLAEFGTVEGVEPDTHLLTPGSKWSEAISTVPFDSNFGTSDRYGLILFLDVLEHLEDPAAALRHALHLLDDDGAIIVTVPAFRWLWTSHDELNHHVTRYSRTSLLRLVDKAGGRVEAYRFMFQWLVPAKLLVRAWEHVAAPKPASPTVPAAFINNVLLGYSRFELNVSRAVGLGFGSSLLAVVRRNDA